MRVEPDIALGESFKTASRKVQEPDHRPPDQDPCPRRDRRRRGGVGDPRLVVDVVDPELDAVLKAAGLDDRHPHRFGIFVLAVPLEHVAHRQDGLERVALRATGRAHVRFS